MTPSGKVMNLLKVGGWVFIELLISFAFSCITVSLCSILFVFLNPIVVFSFIAGGPVAFGWGFLGLIMFGYPSVVIAYNKGMNKRWQWVFLGIAIAIPSIFVPPYLFSHSHEALKAAYLSVLAYYAIPIGALTGSLMYKRLILLGNK